MAQSYITISNFGTTWIRGKFSTAITIPIYDTLPSASSLTNSTEQEGLLAIQGSDDTLHWYSNGAWHTATGGGGSGNVLGTGIATLSNGTVNIAVSGCLTTDSVQVTLRTPSGGMSTYAGVIAVNGTVVINGYVEDTPGVFDINVTDDSTVNWTVIR